MLYIEFKRDLNALKVYTRLYMQKINPYVINERLKDQIAKVPKPCHNHLLVPVGTIGTVRKKERRE